MKAAVYRVDKGLVIEEVPMPRMEADQVLVKEWQQPKRVKP